MNPVIYLNNIKKTLIDADGDGKYDEIACSEVEPDEAYNYIDPCPYEEHQHQWCQYHNTVHTLTMTETAALCYIAETNSTLWISVHEIGKCW